MGLLVQPAGTHPYLLLSCTGPEEASNIHSHNQQHPLHAAMDLHICSCLSNLEHVRVLQIFLGTLREIELERVKEKLSSAIMETCLALTIFREEFNIGFVGMFTVLTFVKVSLAIYSPQLGAGLFGWLALLLAQSCSIC